VKTITNMSQSFLIACENGNRKIAELLLEQEVSEVNYADEKGRTALHYAAHRGYRAICEALIAKGADINYEDHNGETPLFFATLQSQTQVINLLLNSGAKAGIADEQGNNLLHLAIRNGQKPL